MNRTPERDKPAQQDDTRKETQLSHGSSQHRSKKDGHVSQIGTALINKASGSAGREHAGKGKQEGQAQSRKF